MEEACPTPQPEDPSAVTQRRMERLIKLREKKALQLRALQASEPREYSGDEDITVDLAIRYAHARQQQHGAAYAPQPDQGCISLSDQDSSRTLSPAPCSSSQNTSTSERFERGGEQVRVLASVPIKCHPASGHGMHHMQ